MADTESVHSEHASKHDPRCPAYGIPKWADVEECGPCDYLRGRA